MPLLWQSRPGASDKRLNSTSGLATTPRLLIAIPSAGWKKLRRGFGSSAVSGARRQTTCQAPAVNRIWVVVSRQGLRVGLPISSLAATSEDAEQLTRGGHIEEAIHLYVNVLGDLSRAADLVSAQGQHARAAEIRRLAAQNQQRPNQAAIRSTAKAGMREQGDWHERYQLLEELGRGGMAVVYRAHDSRLNRDVAMKFIHAPHDGVDFAARFLSEARAAAGLNHPNIITIFDSDIHDGKMFICMEYVDGQTLEALLARKRLGVAASLGIIKEVLDGLHYAHENGIIHRDIKPANIMRATSSQVKLMDFGIAKAFTEASEGVGHRRYAVLHGARTASGGEARPSHQSVRGRSDPL